MASTCKPTIDNLTKKGLYADVSEFGIPADFIRRCKLTLTKSSIRITEDLLDPFNIKRGFRKADPISFEFYSLLLEKLIENVQVSIRVYSC